MTKRAPEVVPSDREPTSGQVANVSGNHFDKHGSSNPIVRWMMRRFHDDLQAAIDFFAPASVLDAGCGEGRTTGVIARSAELVVGVELERSALAHAPVTSHGLAFVAGSVYELPFADDCFDVVVCTEVLEHLTDPEAALAELIRVARRGVVVTVPREPWWRVANVARGAYLSRLGNTPGHVQHFTKRRLARLFRSRRELARFEIGASTLWRVARVQL